MEQLKVKNFLVIKEANFEVGKVNIIIGSQANGKSILAKLLYMFNLALFESLLYSVRENENQKLYFKRIESLFENYFPNYAWKDKSFEIMYKNDELEIYLSKTISQRKVQIGFSEYLKKLFRELKHTYKKYFKDDNFNYFRLHIYTTKGLGDYLKEPIFIPANRSFFANLQNNIFTFLAGNIDIDPFLKKFGSDYEKTKTLYSHSEFHDFIERKEASYLKINKIMQSILKGKYRYEDKKDWIESDKGLVNVSNASSGQQESLPMLLMLSIFPFMKEVKEFKEFNGIYSIEEPEAHLFPSSQKDMVSIFGLMYNQQQSTVITTHSPYILTAFNNLILAYDVKMQKGVEAIKDIVDEEFCINFDDVRAYTIKNGALESIMDEETRLIGMNIIDSVSDEFNDTFDSLLTLQD